MEKAQKFLKKRKSLDYIRTQLNKDGKVNIISKSGCYEEDDDVLSQFENLSKGVTSIVSKEQYFFVVNITDQKPAGAKELSECKGKAISDYQQYLENNWVDELKSEFSIQVNEDVFAKVKRQLKN